MLLFYVDPHVVGDSPCSPTVYWIAKLNLTPKDRAVLQEGKQLDDKIMAGVGMILESQFPELPPFQPTLYTQALENLHPAKETSFFFHNFSNHWAVSHLSQGRVYLYDSLQPKKIMPELQKQLATLYGHVGSDRKLQVFMPLVQLQRGGADCGCFAVAFVVSLLFGDDPTSLLYSQKEMRGHLEDCLQSELFTPFPASEKKAKRKSKIIELTVPL